jgi:hypothetical protein
MIVTDYLDFVRRVGGTAAAQPQQARMPDMSAVTGGQTVKPIDFSKLQNQKKKDDGPGIGDVFAPLGRGALKVLDFIDTPRATVVSGLKEATDFLQGEGFSTDDFVSQASRNIGARELLDDLGISPPGKAAAVTGFVGDVLLDPLTYITAGFSPLAGAGGKQAVAQLGRNVAQQTADDALRVAIKSGSSRMLSESLAGSARAAGLEGSEAVQRLIVNAAERGRGAITRQGLVRAGVSSDEIAKLGIPRMQRTVGVGRAQVRIPGTTQLVDVAETLKGGVKANLRQRKTAQLFRDKFTPEVLGTKNLTKIIYDTTKNMGDRAGAVVARSTVQGSLAAGRRWYKDTERRIFDAFEKVGWKNLDSDAARVVTNNIEMGASNPFATSARREFSQIHEDAVSAGVEMGDLGYLYAPHINTKEFRDFARRNPDAAKYAVENLNTQEGFQKVRQLRAGDDFLNEFGGGVPLKYGTIDEINERAVAAWGVKMFEDDIRKIMPIYVAAVAEAIARAKQKDLLRAYGLSERLSKRVVRQANMDPNYLKSLENNKAALAKARRSEKFALRNGKEIRRSAIPKAKQIIQGRIKKLADDRRQLTDVIAVARKKEANARLSLEKVRKDLDDLRNQRKVWEGQVSAARKPLRDKARRELKKIDRQITKIAADYDVANESAEFFRDSLERYGKEEGFPWPQYEQFYVKATTEAGALDVRLRGLYEQAEDLNQQWDELRLEQTPAGLGPTPPDAKIAQINDDIEKKLLVESKKMETHEAAAAAHAFALADNEWALQQIDQVIQKHRDALAVLDNANTDVRWWLMDSGMRLKQQMDTVAEVLRRGGDDADSLRLAKFEAAAAASDEAAWAAGRQAERLEKMIDSLNDRKFIDVVEEYVQKGMIQVGELSQMPQWLHEALTIPAITGRSIEINRFMRKFYNLWKGYAILRPGFHVRNFYSGMFNLYLEAGPSAIKSAETWRKFYRILEKNPENYMDKAIEVFGRERAARLDQAWSAVAATGSGQIAGELTDTSLLTGSFNPFSERFGPLRASRRFGEKVENVIRGSHAFDVLERGGTLEQAIDTVNKWQFNYTDLTTWDQNIKLAMPFWTFFSRNIALQAQEWVRTAGRLNRSFVNFDRNVGYGLPEDEDVPAWYTEAGAVQLTGGERAKYLFTDLPAAVWPGQLSDLSTPGGVAQLLGGTAPWIKVPIESIAGRQLFSGIPLKDEFVPLPVGLRNIPGIEALPFVEQSSSGAPMIEAKNLNALMSFLPGLSSAERLFPGTAAGQSRQGLQWLGQATGITLRENTPQTRRGEQYRQLLEQQRQERLRESLG